jgi:hypothetical protein
MNPYSGSITLGGNGGSDTADPVVTGTAVEPTPTPAPASNVWPAQAQKLIDAFMAAFDKQLSRAAMLAEYNRLMKLFFGVEAVADKGEVAAWLDAYEVTRDSQDRTGWFDFLTHANEGSTLWEGVVYRNPPEASDRTMTLVLLLIGAAVMLGGVYWFATRHERGRRR